MGAVQSIPIVGEVVTAIDCGVKLVCAGGCAVAGIIRDDERTIVAAKQFSKDACNTWFEYSEKNVIMAPIRATYSYAIKGDTNESNRVLKRMCKSVEKVVESIPIVGHVKGTFHCIRGDTEHGHDCIKGASRTAFVLGVGALTGGLGAGITLGGAAGFSSGIAYDYTVSKIDQPFGIFASIQQAKKSDNYHDAISSAIDAGYCMVGDVVSGAEAVNLGKSVKGAFKAREQKTALIKEVGTTETTDIVDTAKELASKTEGARGDRYVCTKAKNLDTGETVYGYNRRCREHIRRDEFANKGEASGFKSKREAMKGPNYERESGLLEDIAEQKNIKVKPVSIRAPRACAEHDAINKLGTHGHKSNIQTFTVMQKNDSIVALERCENCKQYGSLMGEVVTDGIDGMDVPTTEFTLGSVFREAVTGRYLACSNAKDISKKEEEDKKEKEGEDEDVDQKKKIRKIRRLEDEEEDQKRNFFCSERLGSGGFDPGSDGFDSGSVSSALGSGGVDVRSCGFGFGGGDFDLVSVSSDLRSGGFDLGSPGFDLGGGGFDSGRGGLGSAGFDPGSGGFDLGSVSSAFGSGGVDLRSGVFDFGSVSSAIRSGGSFDLGNPGFDLSGGGFDSGRGGLGSASFDPGSGGFDLGSVSSTLGSGGVDLRSGGFDFGSVISAIRSGDFDHSFDLGGGGFDSGRGGFDFGNVCSALGIGDFNLGSGDSD